MIEGAVHVPLVIIQPDLERDTLSRDEKTIESLESAQTGRSLRNDLESEHESSRTIHAEIGRYSAGITKTSSTTIPTDGAGSRPCSVPMRLKSLLWPRKTA